MSGRILDEVEACPLMSCLPALHVKELASDSSAFASALRLPSATLRTDTGPEMLVSVALLVAFKSTSRVLTMQACVGVHY